MNPILRNILAVVASILTAMFAITGAHAALGYVIPNPEGFDPTTTESFLATIHLLETKHFLSATLAHACGAFVGGLLVALLAASHKIMLVLLVSIVVFAAGVANAFMIPAPVWLHAFDLIVAYIPMGYLGGKLGGAK